MGGGGGGGAGAGDWSSGGPGVADWGGYGQGGGGSGGSNGNNFFQAGGGGRGGKKRGRERISQTEMTGRLREWRKDFGWIVPSEPIEHPQMQGGRVYVHQEDVEGGQPLPMGVMVSFHLYVDRRGVGAESCKVVGESDETTAANSWIKREDPAAKMAAAMAAAQAAVSQAQTWAAETRQVGPSPYAGKHVPPRFGPGNVPAAAAASSPQMSAPVAATASAAGYPVP